MLCSLLMDSENAPPGRKGTTDGIIRQQRAAGENKELRGEGE